MTVEGCETGCAQEGGAEGQREPWTEHTARCTTQWTRFQTLVL